MNFFIKKKKKKKKERGVSEIIASEVLVLVKLTRRFITDNDAVVCASKIS